MAKKLLFLFSILALSFPCNSTPSPRQGTVRAGYYLPSYSHFSPVTAINTSLYTHLYYSSLSIDQTHLTLSLPAQEQQVQLFATFSSTVKSKNKAIKTILSIATDDSEANASNAAFSAMAADPGLRALFVNSTVELARANGFDGLDIAWRFPASAIDMANFGFLVAEWRARVNRDHSEDSLLPPPLLTATVYFSNHVFDAAFSGVDYPSEAASSNLDWINVMAFGFRRSTNVTIFDAPLYDKESHFSASYGIVSWLDAGIPASKVVMGIPLYGKSWFLRNKGNNGVGAPVVAAGLKQRASNMTGVMAYSEIERLAESVNAVPMYDNVSVSAYLSVGNIWISFDSVTAVEEKIEFVLQCRLLGYFLWPISYDDANFTISKRASEAWLQNSNTSDSKDDTGAKQTQSPFRLPPVLRSPAPMPASTSASTQMSLRVLDLHLHLGVLTFLLYYQRVIVVV